MGYGSPFEIEIENGSILNAELQYFLIEDRVTLGQCLLSENQSNSLDPIQTIDGVCSRNFDQWGCDRCS